MLFDLRADRLMATYSHKQIMSSVTSLDFSLSGRLLFTAYDDFNVIGELWDRVVLWLVVL